MNWIVPKIWQGGDVWIIGGGPSVIKQFNIPDKIAQDVVKGISQPSVYSPYMEAIHNKHVIGINVAYLIGTWVDMVFFGDDGFFKKHLVNLSKFPGLKVSCSPEVEGFDWVKYVQKDKKHSRGISSDMRMVSWNRNSGAAAISVAAHTGAKRIILLGFDMKLDETSKQHWHNLYGKGEIKDARKIKNLPFAIHLRSFPAIVQDAKRMGIEIINASPTSAIKEFRKVAVKDLL
jgi:hypothetical protein